MTDVRQSFSKDLSFGNQTVIPLMQTWPATQAFVYGERSQTLATAIGLYDADLQYAPFGYPITVLLPYVPHLSTVPSWESLLSSWYGIKSADAGSEIMAGDLLVILDITTGSDKRLIARAAELLKTASQKAASILVVTDNKQRLPREIATQAKFFTGSVNSYWKIFAYHPISNLVYNRGPRNIYLVGEGIRVVASAIGALDALARFDESNTSLAVTANRVKVDVNAQLSSLGKNISPEQIFTTFGISTTTNIPVCDGLEISDRQVLITPV